MPHALRPGSLSIALAAIVFASPAWGQNQDPNAERLLDPQAEQNGAEPPQHFATSPAAAPQPLDVSAIEPLLAKLDDPSLTERERATDAIRNAPGLTLRDVEGLARREALTPEQRVRLSQVGQAVFMREPRAAMGVQFAGTMDEADGQVQINAPTQGFDSARVLRAMDIIRTIDGIRIHNNAEARAAIISHDPGDTVQLDIIRNGQPGTVRIRLGNYADLRNSYGLQRDALESGWRLRSARLGAGSIKPLSADIAEGDWSPGAPATGGIESRMARMNHPITSEPLSTRMRAIPISDLAAAGAVRASGERDTGAQRDVTIFPGDEPGQRIFLGNPRAGDAIQQREITKMLRLDSNRRQRDMLQGQIAMIRRQAADPNTDAATAANLRRQADTLSALVAHLDEDTKNIMLDTRDR